MPGRHARRPNHRLIPLRRWPRRVLIAVNLLVTLAVVTAGTGYGYVQYRVNSIHTQTARHLAGNAPARSPGQASSDGLSPENILLIGDQSRAGLKSRADILRYGDPSLLSGNLSDIIAVVHLDPRHDTASLLSIPRDLFVAMPAGAHLGSYQKIDAALNTPVVAKGPDTLIQAITDDLGIPIDHFVEVNFLGFRNVVNALGGINVDFPYPLFDAEAQLYVPQTGCQHLDGLTALAMVRARHLQYEAPGTHLDRSAWTFEAQSDLARIVRTHTFVQIVAAKARSTGLTDPVTANAFLGAITGQITIDPGLKSELTTLVTHYRHLDPASIHSFTLPVTQVGAYSYAGQGMGDVDFPVQPLDQQAIEAWSAGTLPAPTEPAAVQVASLTGTRSAASRLAAALASAGLPATTVASKSQPATPTETVVRYPPRELAQAEAVMADLSGAVVVQPDPTLPAGTVAVDVGSVVAPAGAASAATTTTTAAPTTTVAKPTKPTGTTGTSTSTTVAGPPTAGGQPPSSAADMVQPWDPRPC